MNNWARILGILLLVAAQFSWAQKFEAYRELSAGSSGQPKMYSNEGDGAKESQKNYIRGSNHDNLIHNQINKDWRAPEFKKKLDMIRPLDPRFFSEGTGTRGGGSGLLVKNSDGVNEIQLLDIYRSERLSHYKQFFPVDSELRRIEQSFSADEGARVIFETVLSRISLVAPNFGAKIRNLYQIELPFEHWVPVFSDLPLIEDEVKYPLEENQNKVQIALRRTNQIVYNKRAYAAMKAVSRAALWLHEYIYALSGAENSVRTQRAVSLFFSSDFLKIAKDEMQLTVLFYELDLLAVSRKSIHNSLPPGAKVSTIPATENCGPLTEIDGASSSLSVKFRSKINGSAHELILNRNEAAIVLNAIMWSKSFLEKTNPLYKWPGQRILPDVVCFNQGFTRILQTQSTLAIDDELKTATEVAALAEVAFYRAQGKLAEAVENRESDATLQGLQNQLSEAKDKFEQAEKELKVKTAITLQKVMFPKILEKYAIDISY